MHGVPLSTLDALYGDAAAQQRERYGRLVQDFQARYGPGGVRVFRAPGRVNLIGEHTDYNHGFVMPVALDRDTLVAVRTRSDTLVRLANVEPEFEAVAFEIAFQIPPAPRGHWSNYARGVAQRLSQEMDAPLRGMDVLVDGSPPWGVPRGAGLSSSSALSVALALALVALNGLRIPWQRLARLCQEAEWYTGTRGGIMDQFNALMARQGYALFLDTRPRPDGAYLLEYARLPQGYALVIADTGVRHSNVLGEYNHRVAECRAAVALLRPYFPNITHLRDVQHVPWSTLEALLPEVTTLADLARKGVPVEDPPPGVGPEDPLYVRARVRHVYTENRRVMQALEALQQGDVDRLGRLMVEAHISAREDYQVSCPELDTLVHAALEVEGVVGARLTGAGWGGSIVALAQEDVVPQLEAHLQARYREVHGREPQVFVCRSGPAGCEVLWETT